MNPPCFRIFCIPHSSFSPFSVGARTLSFKRGSRAAGPIILSATKAWISAQTIDSHSCISLVHWSSRTEYITLLLNSSWILKRLLVVTSTNMMLFQEDLPGLAGCYLLQGMYCLMWDQVCPTVLCKIRLRYSCNKTDTSIIIRRYFCII